MPWQKPARTVWTYTSRTWVVRVLAAVLLHINRGARIAVCGLISQYNAVEPPPGPNLGPVLANRAVIRGFIVDDHLERFPAFLDDCLAWMRAGELRYREDIVEGLDESPRAFLGLFEGRNIGKLLVRVSPDPTRAR